MKLLSSVFVLSVASLFTGHAQADTKLAQCKTFAGIYQAVAEGRDAGLTEADARSAVHHSAVGAIVVNQVYRIPGAQPRTPGEIALMAFDVCMSQK